MSSQERVEGTLRAVRRIGGVTTLFYAVKGEIRPRSVKLSCSFECSNYIGRHPVGTALSFVPGASSSPLDNLMIDGKPIEFH